MKRFLRVFLALLLAFSAVLASCGGTQGVGGSIAEKGDKGDKGDKGEKGEDGEKGNDGSSITVISCEKTGSSGSVDTYTILFSDGSTAEFQVNNGSPSVEISEIGYADDIRKYRISYSDGTATEFAVNSESGAATAYADACGMGYEKSESEFILGAMNAAKDLLLGGGSPMDAKVFGNVIPVMLADYYTYFENLRVATSCTLETIIENSGYMSQNGAAKPNSPTQNYVYTNVIPCSPGETVEVWFNGAPIEFRFITAYNNSNCVTSASQDCNQQSVKSYVVPDGINGVIFTYQKRSTVPEARRSIYEIAPAVLETVTVADINKLYYGSAIGGALVVEKNDSIAVAADALTSGQYLKLENNHIMNAKTLTLSFKLDALGEGECIKLGHGEQNYGGSYVEITDTHIKAYNYSNADTHSSGGDVTLNKAHGLELSGMVNITITTHLHNADISVTTAGGVYKTTVSWAGRNGEIFATTTAAKLTDVRMRWFCAAYASDVWILGDSYLNSGSSWRWPYYLRENGYTDYMLTGYPGRKSQAGLNDFKLALTHGTPKYAIWCLGMNDGDSSTAVNASYLKAVQEFIAICKANGITPILSTVPCTPTVNNYFKNQWVKASGYRYIDFARAVGGEEVGSSWFPGMLHTDNVHPNELGAKALYSQFIADFPEICG